MPTIFMRRSSANIWWTQPTRQGRINVPLLRLRSSAERFMKRPKTLLLRGLRSSGTFAIQGHPAHILNLYLGVFLGHD